MPNWKKVITSGSDATLNSLNVSTHITASGEISASGTIYASQFYADQKLALDTDGSTTGKVFGDASITAIEVGRTGASNRNISLLGPVTASGNISLPTNASSIIFNDAEIHGRTGGSYPGLTISSGDSSNARIWLRDTNSTNNPVTMSFIGLGKVTDVQTIEGKSNYPLIVRGGAGPNDVNDGVRIETADNSNVYQPRFGIESDAATVDAYFTNINGLGINDDTPSAMLDVNGNINTTSHITASGNISVSGDFFGGRINAASYVNTPQIQSSTSTLNTTSNITASGNISASGDLIASRATVNGSGSTLFDVIGSAGTLFSVDDDLTGTLFSANDVSGFPVLQASASGDVFIGKTPQSLYTTAVISSTAGSTATESICSLSTSSYDGAFFEYTAREVGNTNSRAGSIMAVWNNGNISFTDTATRDIGNTSLLIIKPIISGSTARLVVYGDGGYKVKTIIKAI